MELEKTTVALVFNEKNILSPFCSGVWIGKKEILTAHHCVKLHLEKKIENVNYKTLFDKTAKAKNSKILVFDEGADLAILRADPDNLDPHPIAVLADEAWDGQHVNIVGHTMGLWWSYIDGIISSTRITTDDFGKPKMILQISSSIWKGNSGGGAWDDQGRLVGIASFIFNKAPMISFFIHHEHIKQLLVRLK